MTGGRFRLLTQTRALLHGDLSKSHLRAGPWKVIESHFSRLRSWIRRVNGCLNTKSLYGFCELHSAHSNPLYSHISINFSVCRGVSIFYPWVVIEQGYEFLLCFIWKSGWSRDAGKGWASGQVQGFFQVLGGIWHVFSRTPSSARGYK